MSENLKPVGDALHLASLGLAGNDIFRDCNEVVSRYAHAHYRDQQELVESGAAVPATLTVEEIYEHLLMQLAALLLIRARANQNEAIVHDWVNVISGKD